MSSPPIDLLADRAYFPAPSETSEHELRFHTFEMLGGVDGGTIEVDAIFRKLEENGISANDPRIDQSVSALRTYAAQKPTLTFDEFKSATHKNRMVMDKALQNNLTIPDWATFRQNITEMYTEARKETGGKPAQYIPQLAKANPNLFAVSVCTIDGQRMAVGDSKENFSIQSCSKPITYCMALEEHGEELVHQHIGREPSGRNFNELSMNNEGFPHNPLINSGAIMACSLISPKDVASERFEYASEVWAKLAGGERPSFDNALYLSERASADRNFCLGYMMRENNAFPEGTNLVKTLELYFQICSLGFNSEQMATVAGTLANGGRCPITGERIFSSDAVRNCLSLMFSCGMYDYSGEFAYKVGLPAKSGVAGAMLIVVPNVMGICTWSPNLDKLGNSVRGLRVCHMLIERFNFHAFDHDGNEKDPVCEDEAFEGDRLRTLSIALCYSCRDGDLREVQQLAACGAILSKADYDGRTPIHLAASEGHLDVVQYLVHKGVDPFPVDRYNGTPLSDARRGGYEEVVEYLSPLEIAGTHSSPA